MDDSAIDAMTETHRTSNPSDGAGQGKKPKVVVIMGPTGSGKSKLAIDLASHFPIEVINADSMQVYRGLDVLTNKVPLSDQKGINYNISVCFFPEFLSAYEIGSLVVGVPHHLLGNISPNVEFTAKEFRDSAIPVSRAIKLQ